MVEEQQVRLSQVQCAFLGEFPNKKRTEAYLRRPRNPTDAACLAVRGACNTF